jgi:hypothetical protein
MGCCSKEGPLRYAQRSSAIVGTLGPAGAPQGFGLRNGFRCVTCRLACEAGASADACGGGGARVSVAVQPVIDEGTLMVALSTAHWTADGYGELLEQSERAAGALLARFAPGERAAVWANNIPEWVVLELAAALAGVTIVTVNPALRERELVHVLGQSRADGIFLVPEYRGSAMAEMLDAVRASCPACARSCRSPTGIRSVRAVRRRSVCRG